LGTILLPLSNAFGQDTTLVGHKLALLEEQLKIVQNDIKNNNVTDLYSQLEELKKQRDQSGNSQALEQQIIALKAELQTKEQQLSDLQKKLTELSTQITSVVSVLSEQTKAKEDTKKLEAELQAAKDKITAQFLGKFKSDVRAFSGFGGLLNSIASTAEILLLFPEKKDKEPTFASIGKYVGLAGGVIGPIIYGSSNEQSTQKAGVITAGLSLTLTGLISTVLKNDKKTQTLIENIARNRDFTDEVLSFSKSARPFEEKSTILYNEIKQYENNTEWRPSATQLNSYYSLITLRRDISIILRQMQAKAEYLRDFQTITQEGKNKLILLIADYKKALDSWEGQESAYLDTYNHLKNLIDKK